MTTDRFPTEKPNITRLPAAAVGFTAGGGQVVLGSLIALTSESFLSGDPTEAYDTAYGPCPCDCCTRTRGPISAPYPVARPFPDQPQSIASSFSSGAPSQLHALWGRP